MSAHEILGFTRSYEAAGDLSTEQFHFVRMVGAVIDAVSAAATEEIPGVLLNKPLIAGDAGTVQISGVAMVEAAGDFTAGSALYVTDAGLVDEDLVAGRCIGLAETASSQAGDIVAVLLKPLGSVGAEA